MSLFNNLLLEVKAVDDVKKENAVMIGKLEHLTNQLSDLSGMSPHKEVRDMCSGFLKVVASLTQYQIGLHNYLRLHTTTELRIKSMHTDLKIAAVLLARSQETVDDSSLAAEVATWIDTTGKLYPDDPEQKNNGN